MMKVRKAYHQALLQRNLYPLKCGIYKLNEVKDFAEKYLLETQKIARSKQTSNRCQLRHCTPEDMHTWLKSAPVFVADELGYKVAPAIKALIGDGLSNDDVKRLRMQIQPRIDALLLQCDDVDDLIYTNIEVEYEQMKMGESLVADLYDRLYRLTDFALSEIYSLKQQAA